MNETQEKMSQPIFESVAGLIELMQKTPDLETDVLPFLNGTLAKIKQLAIHDAPFEVSYELMQIATNYLPKTVHAYCALPIDYRNKKQIKANKTARDLLVGDLTLIKKQVYELENTLFADIERNIRINSNVIKEKFEGQMQLATQMEQESGFINQFDVDTYTASPRYLEGMFTRTPKEPSTTQKTAKVMASTGIVAGKALMVGLTTVAKTVKTLLQKGVTFIMNGLYSTYQFISNNMFLIPVALGVGFIGGLFAILFYQSSGEKYYRQAEKHLNATYHIMQATQLTPDQLDQFSKQDYKQFSVDSTQARVYSRYVVNTANLTVELDGYEKDECKQLVDKHSNSFPETEMKINNIALPEKTAYSRAEYIENNNHKLCYLKENNKIKVTFNNKEIYEDAQLQKKKDPEWIKKQIAIIEDTKKQLQNIKASGAGVYSFDYTMKSLGDKAKVYKDELQLSAK